MKLTPTMLEAAEEALAAVEHLPEHEIEEATGYSRLRTLRLAIQKRAMSRAYYDRLLGFAAEVRRRELEAERESDSRQPITLFEAAELASGNQYAAAGARIARAFQALRTAHRELTHLVGNGTPGPIRAGVAGIQSHVAKAYELAELQESSERPTQERVRDIPKRAAS